jgi:glyoxylase-like metal-dependent hydrolase (beta-lactamase superfamily II)/rhodanese-related sulfurtransferase
MNRFEIPGEPSVAIVQYDTPSLGDHSYLVVGDGRAAVIDPQRDIGRLDALLEREGASLAAVLETHIHNDYVSGGATAAARAGADYVLPAGSGATVEHRALADGECYDLGSWRLRAIHTPGHTPHHMSYALVDADGKEHAVFSGGSMLVGAVGRSDLLGPEHTDGLLRDQFHSVRRLAAELPDPARVGPTHGAGSFCSASEVTETTSTIGREKERNPALVADDVEIFARDQLAGYGLFPDYYAHMAPINLAGADPMPAESPPELDVEGVAAALEDGTPVIDLRPAAQWAGGHVPGSLNIPFSNEVATYVGWVLPWGRPIVLLARRRAAVERIRTQLARIGHDAVAGFAVDVEPAWEEAGRPLSSVPVATFADLAGERPDRHLDVRDPRELREDGAIPGARNIHISRLEEEMGRVPEGTVWVSCASGFRAAIAAGFLERAGRSPVLVVDDVGRHPNLV